MRITRVEPIFVDRYLFVRIHTDAGITGIGEAGTWGHLEVAATALEQFGNYLVDKDPFPIEYHWNMLQRFAYFRGAALMGAVSAIDIALWDIKGQALGVPIYELLGGKMRDKVRVYGHVKAETSEEMVERCIDLKMNGFTAIGHLNPFLDEPREVPYFKPHVKKIRDAVENVSRARAAVGADVDLCIEIHRRLTPAEAVVFAQAIAAFHPMFYEDPIRPDSYDSMAQVADKIPIPIATGERFSSPYEFQMLFARGGVQYARVSVCLCGGITGAKKIAALAEMHNIEVVPHNPLSPLSLAACLQLDACIPNFAIQEYPNSGSGSGWDTNAGVDLRGSEMFVTTPQFEDGFVTIPNTPGLGIALTDDVQALYPALPRSIDMRLHRDGSLVDQ
jgi:galactonate dehydratase